MISTLIVKRYAAPGDALRVRDALVALTRGYRNPLAGTIVIRLEGEVSEHVLDILKSTGYPVEPL